MKPEHENIFPIFEPIAGHPIGFVSDLEAKMWAVIADWRFHLLDPSTIALFLVSSYISRKNASSILKTNPTSPFWSLVSNLKTWYRRI